MIPRVLEKLEWPLIVDALSGFCQTLPGRDQCASLTPNLDRQAVLDRWLDVDPLRRLIGQGYRPPIGELHALLPLIRAATLGQVLGGQDLRQIATLLEATRKVAIFSNDLLARCTTLRRFKTHLYPIPKLLSDINRAIAPDGELNDDASEELLRIRKAKLAVRKRIEETLRKLLHEGELLSYLQDDFFTVRHDRYVVPMRLDGRGRVKGHILDTSSSGQTLFIEPAEIVPINDQLQELELEEKLEIIRIFRELSLQVASDAQALTQNFHELIALDCMSAEAELASVIDAGMVELVDSPTLHLLDARHPLLSLSRKTGPKPCGNSITLNEGQRSLIISGPNAGGKTVVLKTVGLLHLMAKAGLLLPAHESTKLFLYPKIWLEMGDSQNLSANLSTFSGHLLGLKPILEQAKAQDLVLLDELAVGTDPQTAAAIGTSILEELARRQATCVVTTHFDALKGLAVKDTRFRNGSMEFSLANLKPTYRLILDVPGQSYGIEVAEEMGLPKAILERAKELRGSESSALDEAVTQLMLARDQARILKNELEAEKLAALAEKGRWEQEVELVRETRRKTSQTLKDKYESQITTMRQEYEELSKQLRQALKEASSQIEINRENLISSRKALDHKIKDMEGVLQDISTGYDPSGKLPGQAASRANIKPGDPVFVLPVKKAGKVLKVSVSDDSVEVEVGILKLRLPFHDLRLLSPGEAKGSSSSPKPSARPSTRHNLTRNPATSPQNLGNEKADAGPLPIAFTLQTSTNSIDLRGKDADSAISLAWNFIDRALLRGESTIILIHGHGEGTLRNALRDALQYQSPYELRFRSGLDQEGGDGVTVVALS